MQPESLEDILRAVGNAAGLMCWRCPRTQAVAASFKACARPLCMRCLRCAVFSQPPRLEIRRAGCCSPPPVDGHLATVEDAAFNAVVKAQGSYAVSKTTGARTWTAHSLMVSKPRAADSTWEAMVSLSERLEGLGKKGRRLPADTELWALAWLMSRWSVIEPSASNEQDDDRAEDDDKGNADDDDYTYDYSDEDEKRGDKQQDNKKRDNQDKKDKGHKTKEDKTDKDKKDSRGKGKKDKEDNWDKAKKQQDRDAKDDDVKGDEEEPPFPYNLNRPAPEKDRTGDGAGGKTEHSSCKPRLTPGTNASANPWTGMRATAGNGPVRLGTDGFRDAAVGRPRCSPDRGAQGAGATLALGPRTAAAPPEPANGADRGRERPPPDDGDYRLRGNRPDRRLRSDA
jgi:hypothetical protein